MNRKMIHFGERDYAICGAGYPKSQKKVNNISNNWRATTCKLCQNQITTNVHAWRLKPKYGWNSWDLYMFQDNEVIQANFSQLLRDGLDVGMLEDVINRDKMYGSGAWTWFVDRLMKSEIAHIIERELLGGDHDLHSN